MPAVLSPTPPLASSPRFQTAGEWLAALGNVPPSRILWNPLPGTATVDDVVRLAHQENRGVELVDGTLVEKTVGFKESVIAANVIILLGHFVRQGKLGIVSGEQGMIRMLMGNIRMPDVAFFRREDLPSGEIPKEAAPRIAPALAIEVLSPGNTVEEMRLKRIEYFANGVQAVWELDPPTRTLRVYESAERFTLLGAGDTVDGGLLLPGFSARVEGLFEA